MADEKHSTNSPAEEVNVTKTDVVVDVPSETPYYQAFAANDAEWHKAFEKKLIRKVDMRLIPLMIIMYAHCLIIYVSVHCLLPTGTSTISWIDQL